jgi:hypothetical protein
MITSSSLQHCTGMQLDVETRLHNTPRHMYTNCTCVFHTSGYLSILDLTRFPITSRSFSCPMQLLAVEHLLDGGGRVRLGPLKGHTESSVPDELRDDTESSGNTEQDGVEVLLGKTVVGKEDTRVGVDIGPWV